MTRWVDNDRSRAKTSIFHFPRNMENRSYFFPIVHKFWGCGRWVSLEAAGLPGIIVLWGPRDDASRWVSVNEVATGPPVGRRAPCQRCIGVKQKQTNKYTMIPDDANMGKKICLRTGEALHQVRHWNHKSDLVQTCDFDSNIRLMMLKQ